jgi:hypothetical protein
MADHDSASIITLHQSKRAKTGAERARAYRERKKAASTAMVPVPATANQLRAIQQLPSAPLPTVTLRAVTPSRRSAASILLTAAAFALAMVGIAMNGMFAMSLGATDTAGLLFLAIGVAADLVALAVPSCAARLWQARQRTTAAAAWTVWAATFAFAVMAGIGFASTNIADVTTARASRITPAIVTAQAALADAQGSRDRECKGGVGRFCRERENTVAERRQAVDIAMREVQQASDPQTQAAVRAVAWLSRGALQPVTDDFAMLRLILLALLPQIGGVLLMIGCDPSATSHGEREPKHRHDAGMVHNRCDDLG